MRIAIDTMGGDDAPESGGTSESLQPAPRALSNVISGALVAARHLQIGVLLAGDKHLIQSELARYPGVGSIDIDILDAPQRIEMSEPAAAALRRKPNASIRAAAEAVSAGRAAALFSAGHTGASVMAAHAAFGRLQGVDRPALAAVIPTRRTPAVLLDAGATVQCRPHHLVQFAVMGAAYARLAIGCAQPRVGLLSVGEEESKGNDLTREAHQLLKAAPVRFIGNVEGRHVYSGDADVVVCDGFTGNVTLKTSEGLVETVEALLHDELSATFGTRVGYLLSRRAFRRFRKRLDYSEYGGALLLGVNGVCIVGHGRSSAKAVRNAVALAARCVRDDLVVKLARGVGAVAH